MQVQGTREEGSGIKKNEKMLSDPGNKNDGRTQIYERGLTLNFEGLNLVKPSVRSLHGVLVTVSV